MAKEKSQYIVMLILMGLLLVGSFASGVFYGLGVFDPKSDGQIDSANDPKPTRIDVAENVVRSESEGNLAKARPNRKVAAETNPVPVTPKIMARKPAAVPVEEQPPAPKPVETVATSETPQTRDMWLWAGLGASYSGLSQTAPGYTDLGFEALKGPSSSLRAGFFLSSYFGMDFTYKNTPGEVKTAEGLKVGKGEYEWKSLSYEFLFRGVEYYDPKKSSWFLRLGVQQHQMPFIVPTAEATFDVLEASLNTASLGFDYHYPFHKLRIEYQLKYQYPIGSSAPGNQLEYESKMAFDGSLGAAYNVGKNYYFGIYWYGQYHSYDFYFKDSSTQNDFTGESSLFHSNVDLRLGAEF